MTLNDFEQIKLTLKSHNML